MVIRLSVTEGAEVRNPLKASSISQEENTEKKIVLSPFAISEYLENIASIYFLNLLLFLFVKHRHLGLLFGTLFVIRYFAYLSHDIGLSHTYIVQLPTYSRRQVNFTIIHSSYV